MPTSRPDKVTVYRGAAGLPGEGAWYWHRKAPNGEVIADGGEGYATADAAMAAARRANPDLEPELQEPIEY